jgi:hypothetical protein
MKPTLKRHYFSVGSLNRHYFSVGLALIFLRDLAVESVLEGKLVSGLSGHNKNKYLAGGILVELLRTSYMVIQ